MVVQPITASVEGTPLVIHTVQELRTWRAEQRKLGKRVGLVPTMGALHEGHLALVQSARNECDVVVVSIFVNPAQFAPHEDLAQYPRTLTQDVQRLSAASGENDGKPLADVVLAPAVAEMYPSGITVQKEQQQGAFVEVVGLSHQMEGVTRPHFFRGVATVVTKLFNIVQPDVAFFGQKDAQQCVVVKALVRDLCFPIRIVVVPTVRDSTSALALSSRNKYLTADQRHLATTLYRGLQAAEVLFSQGECQRDALLEAVNSSFTSNTEAEVELEYLSLAHPTTLEELDRIEADGAILSGAFRVGTTRLIDNVLLGCTL
ncbi:pantoate-beta-alanine ligase [Dispira parvispora]|uniref:Pantoate--beta-alanine ligase n=1 Tax=Dispira parvispora TaxID=1520584 RepID=A0A9W8AN95_9FUNG|nr:pantoate-beta-alanine ligase [Dispira parvispora]